MLLASNALADDNGFLIGAGLEGDSDSGIRGSVIAGLGISEDTWLSGGVSQSSVELPNGRDIDTLYADLEIDHFFDPVGVRAGVSYWGDSDILDSNDYRASLYWRGDKVELSGEYEFRDFDFIVPALDLASVREFMFDADGIGLRARFELSDNVSMSLSGKSYDYSVDFVPAENTDVISLFSVTRLSLINSLISDRAALQLSVDQGLKRWEIDLATWEGEVDNSRTNSLTLRYLVPMSGKADIEFALGYDDSDLYGDITFFSVFIYFYGGS